MTLRQAHQAELISLAELAGISASPAVFRIILELLALQISPDDIYNLLKELYQGSHKSQTESDFSPELKRQSKML